MMNGKKFLAVATALTISATAFTTGAFAKEHTVQPGDTLYKISTQYNTTVESLKEKNQLNSNIIYVGERLTVDESSSKKGTYTIQNGDTLFKIAVAHNVSVENLKAWNGLSSDLIFAGEQLAVSAASAKGNVAPSTQASVSQPAAPVKQQAAQTQQKQQVAQQPQQQAPTQTQSAQQGATASASKTLTVSATAYTAYCAGCSGVTANGTDLRANPNQKVIAVDPSVIPLGSRVWVEGYGEAIAADTGGAIKGNKIDVFVPSQEGALNWGRRTVQIKVLN